MPIFHVVMGCVVLFFGRKLFWVFVAYVGFLMGFQYAPHLFPHSSGLFLFLIALGAGILGAVLAIFFQQGAIIAAGFFAGWYLTTHMMPLWRGVPDQFLWMILLAGGIIGAVLVWGIFDYALIGLSSFLGASTLVSLRGFRPHAYSTIFVILFLVGVFVQAFQFHKELRK